MARDRGGCEMCSASAARPKCSRSATAMKYRISRISGRFIPIGYYSNAQIALAAAPAPAHNRARMAEIYTPGHSENVSSGAASGRGRLRGHRARGTLECYDSRQLIAEYLARRLEEAGDVASASALRDWSSDEPGMFAQAWVSAVARKPYEPSYDRATPTGGDDGNSRFGA